VCIGHNVSGLFKTFNERMPVLLVKEEISVSEPPFGGKGARLTGSICDSSIVG